MFWWSRSYAFFAIYESYDALQYSYCTFQVRCDPRLA